MIRLRARDGQVLPLPPDVPYVEITDLEGSLARVIYQDGTMTTVIGPSDPEAASYAKRFGAKWCKVVELDKSLFPGAAGLVDRTTRR